MAIWVDDGIICSFIKDKFQSIINYINNKQCEFTSGPVQCFVGIQIQRDRKNKIIHLSQGTNIEQLLNKFNMSTYHTRVVPSHPHSRLSKALDSPEQEFSYREAIGSMIFVASSTRPDIAYPVNQASQHCKNPSRSHWEAVTRILSYLRGSKIWELVLDPRINNSSSILNLIMREYERQIFNNWRHLFCFLNGKRVS
jgi:hypothetical protein